MSKHAQVIIDQFWEIIEELLNCILFLLIGFELLLIAKGNHYLFAGLLAIPVVLFVRLLNSYISNGVFLSYVAVMRPTLSGF